MPKRAIIAVLLLGISLVYGCRTGEYKVDREIYGVMPALLAADPVVLANAATNEDGSINVQFEKGVMMLYLREGRDMDEDARELTIGQALQIFHDQYMQNPSNRRPNGSFIRDKIGVKGYVGDIELYVIEWNLADERPNVVSNRYGNFT